MIRYLIRTVRNNAQSRSAQPFVAAEQRETAPAGTGFSSSPQGGPAPTTAAPSANQPPSFIVTRLKRLQGLLGIAPLFVVNILQQTNYHAAYGVAAGLAVLSIIVELPLLILGYAKARMAVPCGCT